MHTSDGFFDGLVWVLKIALALLAIWMPHLVRWHVSADTDALRTKSLKMGHAEHVDRLIVFRADGILQRVQGSAHLTWHHLLASLTWQIVTHL